MRAPGAGAGAASARVPSGHGRDIPRSRAGIERDQPISARSGGFQVTATQRATDFTGANLARYRAVVFLNTAGNRLNGEQEGALADFMEAGGGFVGIGTRGRGRARERAVRRPDRRAAGPGEPDRARRRRRSRSATASTRRRATCRSSSTAPTSGTAGRRVRPATSTPSRAGARSPTPAGDGTSVGGTDHPISWCRDVRGGRSFYTGMGRTADELLRGAVPRLTCWARSSGRRASCAATARRRSTPTTAARAWCSGGPVETGLATSGESHGLTIAPNGWVIYIGRGDCRTDAERGALVGLPALGADPRPRRPERRARLRQHPRVGPGGRTTGPSTAA